MSEEMEKLFWELKQYLVQYSPKWDTLCDIEQYIIDVEHENKELKKINGSLQNVLSLSRQKYNNDKQRYRRKYKKEHNILTEFEKWLEKKKKKLDTSNDFDKYARLIIIECLDKLQELKGSDK